MFGPHETNLGQGRAISARHVAYYLAPGGGRLRRHRDRDRQRAPVGLALRARAAGRGLRAGLAQTVAACAPHGALVLAGLGHAGMQGSSAFSPGRAVGTVTGAGCRIRELPMEMAQTEINEVVDGFAAAAAVARRSGLHGLEINAGQYRLLRQFVSGLTNLRD